MPSLLKFVPTQAPSAEAERETPSPSSAPSVTGSVARLLFVPMAVTTGKIAFRKSGSFLFMRLPSGRCLSYPYPRVLEIKTPWGAKKPALTFKTVPNQSNKFKIIKDESNTSRWARVSTYGGGLAENATQAVSRDVLAEAMLRVEAAGYPLVMSVHDENVAEPSAAHGSNDEFSHLMAVAPA